MEAYYDAQVDSEESTAEKSVPTATLSPEIEQFLSELGDRLNTEGEQ